MPSDTIPNPELRPHVDEDEPVRRAPGESADVASPLAKLRGERPESPAWFKAALAREPERSFVSVDGTEIELLTWGTRGKPGLIFIHGNGAHADWWSFIAPFFADDYRVAALSFSGMGASGWRDGYSFSGFAEEIHQCALAAGLYDGPQKPIYIAHSFGGAVAYFAGATRPERMRACLLVDTGFGGPPTPAEIDAWEAQAKKEGRPFERRHGPGGRTGPNRVYATQADALARFRLMPPQAPGNLYPADFIARGALKRAPMVDGSGEGWTWRFDPFIWDKLDRTGMGDVRIGEDMPLAHIYGDQSLIIQMHSATGRFDNMVPQGSPQIAIPDCAHHVMVDQPIALVAAIRALLATWPG